ncbi:MAG: B12-binding domain-containing radical SAM protein, partial [Acidimicrobiia bacterium]
PDARPGLEGFLARLTQTGWITTGPSELSARAAASALTPPVRLPELDETAAISTPLSLRPVPGGYEFVSHLGDRVATVTWQQLLALREITEPTDLRAAVERHRRTAGSHALGEDEFLAMIGRLAELGVVAIGHHDQVPRYMRVRSEGLDDALLERDRLCQEVFTRFAAVDDAEEGEREARTGVVRPEVIPVAFDPVPPLALALITAYAKVFDGGRLDEHYRFRREWVWLEDRFEQCTSRPAIYMFSNYLWSHAQCIEISRRVKGANPSSITIHGGPDTPKYEGDARAYFDANPHVDITVRGEGEQSAVEVLRALMSVIGDEVPDLSVLSDVPGIYFRGTDGVVVRTPDRERISDLDVIPSPFLTGLFDAYAEVPGTNVTIETNRGCPYGCTFCDWGSATLSRIRKFDLQRVYDEIDWCAKSHMQGIGPADSNFGIFERDVSIAERVAQMKEIHGYPRFFGVSYAKNTVKHLQHIIQTMANAGIVTQGILSLQTMDEDTLDAIHRSNIKTEKYDALAGEMRRADLPLFVDLMVGLPGSTIESFTKDLQQCIDREVQVRIPQTTLLVNSPMNDPDYRAEHQIEVQQPLAPGRPAFVVSTSTFTRQDYLEMVGQRRVFLLFENFGVMRQISRFVHQETGTRETDLYERMRRTSRRHPDRWPLIQVLTGLVPHTMEPPVSWGLVMDEVRRFLVSEIGVAEDSALDTALTVQLGLLPSHDRMLPETLELSHDYGAWFREMVAIKESPERDRWTELLPRLREYGPAQFRIDDPGEVARAAIGCNIELHGFGLNWEFESPIRRAFIAKERTVSTLGAI